MSAVIFIPAFSAMFFPVDPGGKGGIVNSGASALRSVNGNFRN